VCMALDDPASRSLAENLGLPLRDRCPPEQCPLLLGWQDGRLSLYPVAEPRASVTVDFQALARRFGPAAGIRRQPLVRALGARKQTVVDATAGLGQDAFLMAWLGSRVTAVERSAVLAALVADGLDRALAVPELAPWLGERLKPVVGDARELLQAITPRPDVIYMDPMFPPKRKKSALTRKSVQMIRALVGDDPDAAELLRIARRIARHRVVVKRPDYAPPLAPDPDAAHSGKLARYDVYVTPGSRDK
jgi:16S rRNA (guanine1516-N2)-methyltransferase